MQSKEGLDKWNTTFAGCSVPFARKYPQQDACCVWLWFLMPWRSFHLRMNLICIPLLYCNCILSARSDVNWRYRCLTSSRLILIGNGMLCQWLKISYWKHCTLYETNSRYLHHLHLLLWIAEIVWQHIVYIFWLKILSLFWNTKKMKQEQDSDFAGGWGWDI